MKNEIVPLFCRVASDAVTITNVLSKPEALKIGFQALRVAGMRGIHVTIFWGIVESEPRVYDWSAYEELFEIAGDTHVASGAATSAETPIYQSVFHVDN